ncbi:MAG: FkbM family methyltransferase [Euryarchaeota archaeon]|nr:FkbM family methyltransferase [Euryarchaeota archaeon]MDE1881614.1 FkbM family methyltransferase [Euryarchaeota archaeon]MDE2045153.1 FkbM family methyltransferase [Thermoplasmata archaeon]
MVDLTSRVPGSSWWAQKFMITWFHLYQAKLLSSVGPSLVVPLSEGKLDLDLRQMRDVRTYWALRRDGSYEPETTALLGDLLRPGELFVDVGANSGYFTALAQSWVRPNGRVVAFEPNPEVFRRLQANVRLNSAEGLVSTRCEAAGEKRSEGVLRVERFEDGWGSLVSGSPSSREFAVQVVSLDGVLPASRAAVVKIDVEGSELAVIRGMSNFLRSTEDMAVIVEWNRQFASQQMWEALSNSFSLFQVTRSDAGRGYGLRSLRAPQDLRRVLNTNLLGIKGPIYASRAGIATKA